MWALETDLSRGVGHSFNDYLWNKLVLNFTLESPIKPVICAKTPVCQQFVFSDLNISFESGENRQRRPKKFMRLTNIRMYSKLIKNPAGEILKPLAIHLSQKKRLKPMDSKQKGTTKLTVEVQED